MMTTSSNVEDQDGGKKKWKNRPKLLTKRIGGITESRLDGANFLPSVLPQLPTISDEGDALPQWALLLSELLRFSLSSTDSLFPLL